MTVENISRRAGPFIGDGTVTAFPFEFKIFDASQIVVYKTNEEDAEVALKLNEDYTVSLNTDQDESPGGTITLAVPLESERRLALVSAIKSDQQVKVTNYDRFFPIVFNDVFDKLTGLIQQLEEQMNRTLLTLPTDTMTPLQLRYELIENTKTAVSSAAKALQSEANAATSAATSKEYADKLLAFKDQIVTVSDNIKSVGVTAENAEAIAEIAKNLEELLKSKDYAAEAKGWAEKANAITGGQSLIMPGGTSPLPVLDWIAAKPHVFKSVADMKAAKFLAPGMTAVTQGYYAPGDGGSNAYFLKADDGATEDGGSVISLKDALSARPFYFNGFLNVKQFGAKGDGTTDDTEAIRRAIRASTHCTLYFPAGVYAISGELIGDTATPNLSLENLNLIGDFNHSVIKNNAENKTIFANSNKFYFSRISAIMFIGDNTTTVADFIGNNVQTIYFDHCRFQKIRTIIKSAAAANAMSSELTLFNCRVQRCGTEDNFCRLFILKNSQAVNWRFFGTDIESFHGWLFSCIYGTNIAWYQGSCIPFSGGVIEIPENADSNYWGAGNSPNFTFDAVRMELRGTSQLIKEVGNKGVGIDARFIRCGLGSYNLSNDTFPLETAAARFVWNLSFKACSNLQKFKLKCTNLNTSIATANKRTGIKFKDTDLDIADFLTNSSISYSGNNTGNLPRVWCNDRRYWLSEYTTRTDDRLKDICVVTSVDKSGIYFQTANNNPVVYTFNAQAYVQKVDVVILPRTAYAATKLTLVVEDAEGNSYGSIKSVANVGGAYSISVNKFVKQLKITTTSSYQNIVTIIPAIITARLLC